jgi:ribosomal protein L4
MASRNGKKVTGKRPSANSARKMNSKSAANQLNQAASKTLKENSSKIAKSLLKGALEGDVPSTKLLIGLVDGPEDGLNQGQKRWLESLAENLANEPDWEASDAEAAGEVMAVCKESED